MLNKKYKTNVKEQINRILINIKNYIYIFPKFTKDYFIKKVSYNSGVNINR